MNRRSAIVASTLGAVAGTLWAGGFGLLLNRHDPTLEVIGRGDDLMALLDTGSVRALIVAGEGRPERLGSLLGVFRRRVDILLGSKAGIAAIGSTQISRLGVTWTFVLDVPTGVTSFPAANVTGAAMLRAELPEGMSLDIATYPSGAWQGEGPVTQSWSIGITRGGHRCEIVPGLDVLALHGKPGVAVGIGTYGDMDRLWDMLRIPFLAINANQFPTQKANRPGLTPFRIFPNDPLAFTFRDSGIAVAE